MDEKKKVSCINCAATNNYPTSALGKKVVCGLCKTRLPEPGAVVEPSPEQVLNLFNNAGLPILADFYSPTCAPCLMMSPVIERLAKRRAGELMVVKIDIDQNPQLGSAYGVQGVPTFIIISKGNERQRSSGAMSETDFSLWIASLI